ncbi:MAG: ATP-binding protein [Chloroflexi bacterium]|nr:ATP-binding protein [Chloroflexota bacterium]
MTDSKQKKIGLVVAGSLNKGIDVRLDSSASIEDITVGRYVTINGKAQNFFGMVSDLLLETTDSRLVSAPPHTEDPFISEVLKGTNAYGLLHVTPYLSWETALNEPSAVKTIPGHFSETFLASDEDIERVFGDEEENRFMIGNPLDMETKLCLDLKEFATRSNGIFGKSGTGKTFLTRILLIGMLQKSQCSNLIFDMHNEYGWEGTHEDKTKSAKGLKQLFPERVSIFTLDEKHAQRRLITPDFVVKISYKDIEPEDISLLKQTLNLTSQAVEATYQLKGHYGGNWLSTALNSADVKALAEETGIHESTLLNLKRGLRIIERMPFTSEAAAEDAVKHLVEVLQSGRNVVLEFGHNKNLAAYMLVANMLSRRIYKRYQQETERAQAEGKDKPQPLIITIEEAHKFLGPEVAGETIFGEIAREMRKFNVSLLVIDQRPSGIDEEVMSQLGTKVSCLLDNEKDVDSVLSGTSGKSALKAVLARLAAKQQALIFGHAVPMPVAFTPREYGSEESYRQITYGKYLNKTEAKAKATKDTKELWEEF